MLQLLEEAGKKKGEAIALKLSASSSSHLPKGCDLLHFLVAFNTKLVMFY